MEKKKKHDAFNEEKKIFSKRLVELLSKKEISRTKLAEKTGIALSSISDYVLMKTFPKHDKIKLIADYLNVSPSYLIGIIDTEKEKTSAMDKHLTPYNTNMVKIPHLGSIRAGFEYTPEYYDGEFTSLSEDVVNGYDRRCLYTLTVKGYSMYPVLMPNDLVLIHKELIANNGDTVAVFFEYDDTSTIKKIYRDEKNKTITLVSTNPEYPDKVFSFKEAEELGFNIAGKVVSLVGRKI